MVAAKIRLDLNGKKGPDIWARIGEDATRQVVMKPGFFNDEGEFEQLVIDADDIFAKFRVVKPDGTFVIYDASLYTPTSNPAEFVVTLTEEMSQVKGVGYYDLRIGDGETPDTFLYSASGRFIVDDDMITDEMIASVASVNGLIFPDDFLTSDALEEALEDYATKEYVNDAIADIPSSIHEYSETEKIVGKWIDGSDVYEKTILVDSGFSTSMTIQHGIDHLGDVISITALAKRNNDTYMPIPDNVPVSNYYAAMDAISDSGIDIYFGNIIVSMITEICVIIRYTKTS